MTCLIDMDHDDSYEQLLMKVVKARKKYQCGECGDPIQKGDMFECFVGFLDGIHTHRTCQTCLSIRNKFCCNWTYDGMYDDINDSMENDREYNQLVRFVPYLDENSDYYEDEDEEDEDE
jgi:hypothetical protein